MATQTGSRRMAARRKLALLGSVLLLGAGMNAQALDVSKFAELTEFSMGGEIQELVFSPLSTQVAASSMSKGGALWDLKTGRAAVQVKGHEYDIGGFTFTPDGKTLYSASKDRFQTWQTSSGKNTGNVALRCQGGDSGNIALLGGDRILIFCGGLKVVSAKNGSMLDQVKGGPNTISSNSFALSPDKKTLLSAIGYPEFQLWDVATMTPLRALKGHTGQGTTAVAFAKDNKTVATGASDKTVRIWNSVSGKVLKVLEGHTAVVREVAFSPDGQLIVSVSDDLSVRIWNVASGQEVKVLDGGKDYVTHVAWSPDGKFIATGNSVGDIKIFGLPGGL
jgi:WD40 repeat protein